MDKSEAKGKALAVYDEWNDVAWVMPKGTSYYYECQSVIEDAFEIGFAAGQEHLINEKLRGRLNEAIKALDKQDSAAVKFKIANRGSTESGEYDIGAYLLCPVCNNCVGDYETDGLFFKFCPECRQKLLFEVGLLILEGG